MTISKIRDDFYTYRQKLKRKKQFREDFNNFLQKTQHNKTRFDIEFDENKVIYSEATNETEFDRQYIYHTAWAIRKIIEIKPEIHIDISSSLYFIGMLSAIQKVDFYDFRPANLILDNLKTESADLTRLPFANESISCLSCMHVIEHIGLGRYGDPIDYEGDVKAINELKRVTKKNGYLLFVTPIGSKAKIIYNLHRIYTHDQILSYFKDLSLVEWQLIPENEKDGGLVSNPSPDLLQSQNYACGCYLFKKD
jgi:SAM-dependent methyltransferase